MKVKCNKIKEDDELCSLCVHAKPHQEVVEIFDKKSYRCTEVSECGTHEIDCKCEEVTL